MLRQLRLRCSSDEGVPEDQEKDNENKSAIKRHLKGCQPVPRTSFLAKVKGAEKLMCAQHGQYLCHHDGVSSSNQKRRWNKFSH